MSFPRRGRGGGNSGAPNPLASLPYVRQGVAPPARLYPPFRGSDAPTDDAPAPAPTEGLPASLYPCVPLAPGSRDKRAVEAQLLLRQRMRLSAFYLTRAAALASRSKKDPSSSGTSGTSGTSGNSGTNSNSNEQNNNNSSGTDAAIVVMSEALPAARALVPAELLETGPARRHDAHRPPRKRARGAGGDVDVEGLFSSLAQEEAREGQQGAPGPRAGDEKDGAEGAESESDVEGSDGGEAEDESDADDGDYDMGQYGSDEDGGDDYGDAGGDDGDDGDDGGYD